MRSRRGWSRCCRTGLRAGGGRWADHRKVINGVLWRTRTGSPWRDLPECYGCWQTVYDRHRRWSADGTWAAVLAELRRGCDAAEGAGWMVAVDSGTARAHQHAAGARRSPAAHVRGAEPKDTNRPRGRRWAAPAAA
jgi:transposase